MNGWGVCEAGDPVQKAPTWHPCDPGSELEGRPVLGQLPVTVLVKAQLYSYLHGLGSWRWPPHTAVSSWSDAACQASPLGALLTSASSRGHGWHSPSSRHCIQLLLPLSFCSVLISRDKALAQLLGDFHIAQVTFYLPV